MATTSSLDEEINRATQPRSKDQEKADELAELNQRQRNYLKRGAANRYGNKAGNYAQNNLGATAGQGAALGAATSAALQGQGTVNILKAGGGGWAVYTAMAALLDMVTWIGFFSGLVYLNFHYIMSKIKKGQGFFINMAWWQKGILILADFLVLLVPMLFILLVYTATCGNTIVSSGLKVANMASFGYIENFCAAFKGEPNISPPPPSLASAELDIVLTSAYRPGAFVDNERKIPSAHGRGEAFDIALINPTVGPRPNPPDPRIAELISLGVGLGFVEPVGNVVDEYNFSQDRTTGPHIHLEFNNGYCSGAPAANPPTDLVPIPASIPRSGVSDARVRSCMLPYVMQLFQRAGVIDT